VAEFCTVPLVRQIGANCSRLTLLTGVIHCPKKRITCNKGPTAPALP
jgi:hypothetical protein